MVSWEKCEIQQSAPDRNKNKKREDENSVSDAIQLIEI